MVSAPKIGVTDVLPVDADIIQFDPPRSSPLFLHGSALTIPPSPTKDHVKHAANGLRTSSTPVAFPTETVYGLGADATSSEAVRNIFAAKQRPADNPLIVHVHSLEQLASSLNPKPTSSLHKLQSKGIEVHENDHKENIPAIYNPLIEKFWPGPLTIILPNPDRSQLAPEVTAGLSTFGARMPAHPVALALLKASDLPLAAPSANASTRPSPTTASHVFHDLQGRINTIIDGGPCGVGVESTVVDGLSNPPCVLRPGGISLRQIQQCVGWENAVVGYQDGAGHKTDKPKAPGMKYKHYSPIASVVLFESGKEPPHLEEVRTRLTDNAGVGVIRTAKWPLALGFQTLEKVDMHTNGDSVGGVKIDMLDSKVQKFVFRDIDAKNCFTIWDVALSGYASTVAKGLFAALRFLDSQGVSTIFVEGIDERCGDTAAAVMNRLRKAAEIKR